MFSFRKILYSELPEHRESSETLLEDGEDGEKDMVFDGLPKIEAEMPSHRRPYSPYQNRLWAALRYAHVVLTLVLVLLVVHGEVKAREMSRWNAQLLYSPAQDAIRYVTKTFSSSLDYGKTEFQGKPSEKNNQAWSDLILRGLTRITAEEAAPMHNRTMPIPDDPEHYIISLAVFHQLHCLNAIRFAIWNETMDAEKEKLHHETDIAHLDHCVDLLRQALMCAADVTPFVWARDPRDGRLHGITTVAHTCRDWDAVEQWAAERPIVTGFNVTKPHIRPDPLGWANFSYIMDYGEVTDWDGQRAEYDAWAAAKTHEQHLRGHVGYVDATNYP